ncbi:hypothetical protein ACFXGA_00890 [Actinosynnema sp. NPDC059335]|uniref:hypothetical protein n=1 Tax=Actinosynnema sp. NPDC059335 TaxID=3346804 RepID=UPI00367262FA
MKTRTRRTLFLVGTFVVGLVAGLVVWWEPREPQNPPTTPETSWSEVPAREPEIEASVRVGGRADDDGWMLMASEQLARATPPDDVADCRGLREWALEEGALPAGYATHTITLSANYHTTIEYVQVEVSPDTTPYPKTAADGPRVRLICLPRPGAQIPFPDAEAPRAAVNGGSSIFDQRFRTAVLTERHRLTPQSSADLEVVVDFSGSAGPSAYRVEVRVGEDGESRVVPVNGDAPMFATEDGSGMGYWPPTALWTMSPTRTHTYCDAVSNPAPDQEPPCS